MTPIEPPDSHHLRAFMGWMSLGNAEEADKELAKLSPRLREHPLVLQACCAVAFARKHWSRLSEFAGTLAKLIPEDSTGWLHLATALDELGRPEEALLRFEPVAARFQNEAQVVDLMVSLLERCNRPEDAATWLAMANARRLGGPDRSELPRERDSVNGNER